MEEFQRAVLREALVTVLSSGAIESFDERVQAKPPAKSSANSGSSLKQPSSKASSNDVKDETTASLPHSSSPLHGSLVVADQDVMMLQRILVDDPKLELMIGMLPVSSISTVAASRRIAKSISNGDDRYQSGSGKDWHKQQHHNADICSCIIRTFNYGKRGYARVLHLVQTILTIEVEAVREDCVNQLFRGNSLGCKIVSTFTGDVGSSYLKLLIEPLIDRVISALDEGVEFGGKRAEDPQVSGQVTQSRQLSESSQSDGAISGGIENQLAGNIICGFLDSVLSSTHSCPKPMGQLCVHLREIVRQRFPNHANVALSSFLFLRFFCPAIVSPSNAGLSGVNLSKKTRKALIYVAKAVQCLANSVHLEVIGKRSENAWPLGVETLHKYREQMMSYFDDVCEMGIRSESPQQSTFKDDNLGHVTISRPWGFTGMELNYDSLREIRRMDAMLIKGILLENLDILVNRMFVLRDSVLQRVSKSGRKDADGSSHRNLDGVGINHKDHGYSLSAGSNSALERLRAIGSGIFGQNGANPSLQSKKSHSHAKSRSAYKRSRSEKSSSESCVSQAGVVDISPPTVLPHEADNMMGVVNHRTSIFMSEYYRQRYRRCKGQFMTYFRLPAEKWMSVKTSSLSVDGYNLSFSKLIDVPGTECPVRNVGVFPVSAEQFFERLCGVCATRDQWDDGCLKCYEIERLSNVQSIMYTIMRSSSSMLYDRDYVYLTQADREKVGGEKIFTLISCSIHREDCPAVKGLVRGHIHFEGYLVQSVNDVDSYIGSEDLGCTVTYIASSDLKGWVPTFVANQVATPHKSILGAVMESIFTIEDADHSVVL